VTKIGFSNNAAQKQSQGNIRTMAAASKSGNTSSNPRLNNVSQVGQMKASKSKTQFSSFQMGNFATINGNNQKTKNEKENNTSVPRNNCTMLST